MSTPLTGTPRILVFANQKGGVGKTTSAVNLATALAACGKSVLLVDLDPQGNASTGLGLDPTERGPGSYGLLLGLADFPTARRATAIPGLTLLPASPDLAGAEIELVDLDRREFRLRERLRPVADAFDFVLIDCPPSLSLLTINAMVAADAVLVPMQCEFYALEGLTQLLRTIERLRAGANPDLHLAGILLTMFDKRSSLNEQVAADIRAHFGDKVFAAVIPRNVRLAEAPSYGKPALLYDWRCAGSQAYVELAREFLARAA